MEHYRIEDTSVQARVARRDALLSKAARIMASGIVAVNIAIVVMCGVGAVEGKASEDTPSAVTLMAYSLLEDGENDTVARVYWDDTKSDWVKREIMQAAYTHCGSTEVYEDDLSCK